MFVVEQYGIVPTSVNGLFSRPLEMPFEEAESSLTVDGVSAVEEFDLRSVP